MLIEKVCEGLFTHLKSSHMAILKKRFFINNYILHSWHKFSLRIKIYKLQKKFYQEVLLSDLKLHIPHLKKTIALFLAKYSTAGNTRVQEIRDAFATVKTAKSFGTDNISSYFLKLALPLIENWLAFLLNTSIETSRFPDSWKVARVTPIFKD